jgi:predicted transcriptional regulator
METETKEIVRTTIDLPAALNAKLMQEAEKTKRSRHSQMLIALEKFFEPPNGNGKKEKAK